MKINKNFKSFKSITFLLIGILLGSLIPIQTLWANNPIKLIVNGVILQDSLQPINFENHVYVPARTLSEALGASVSWDSNQNAVIVTSGNSTQSTTKNNTPNLIVDPVTGKTKVNKPESEKTTEDKELEDFLNAEPPHFPEQHE